MLRPLILALFLLVQLQLGLEVHDHLDGSDEGHCPSYLVAHAATQAVVQLALPALLWSPLPAQLAPTRVAIAPTVARAYDPCAPRGPPA